MNTSWNRDVESPAVYTMPYTEGPQLLIIVKFSLKGLKARCNCIDDQIVISK
jgi:hypothetical protein